jgi:hypothetical protein
MLPIVPAMAIVATAYGPYTVGRRAVWLLAFAGVAFAGKAAFPSAPWGLTFHRGTTNRVAPLLSDYCARERAHELILVDMDDDLYAAALPLPKLRYAVVGAGVLGGRYEMPFDFMGIVMTAAQFNDLARWTPVFRQHLSEWGIQSDEPIATVITATTPEELAQMIRAHPGSDFLIPAYLRQAIELAAPATREVVEAPGYFFLLSRQESGRAAPPAWSCRL